MIGVMLKSHFASAGGGPGDFRSDETLERRFGEFGHSENPRTLAGSIPGGSPDFGKFGNSTNLPMGPVGPSRALYRAL